MNFLSQVLTETSYTRAVDWWGLGVLIFEMLVGEVSSYDFQRIIRYTYKVYCICRIYSIKCRICEHNIKERCAQIRAAPEQAPQPKHLESKERRGGVSSKCNRPPLAPTTMRIQKDLILKLSSIFHHHSTIC